MFLSLTWYKYYTFAQVLKHRKYGLFTFLCISWKINLIQIKQSELYVHVSLWYTFLDANADCSPGLSQFINYSSSKISLHQMSIWFLAVTLTLPGWTKLLRIFMEQLCARSCFTLQVPGTGSSHTWVVAEFSRNFSSVLYSLSLDLNCTECLLVYTCQKASAPLWTLECQ